MDGIAPSGPSRALFLAPASPWGASSGGQQRTALLYGAIAELMPANVLVLEEGGENRATAGDRPEILAKISWKQPPLTLYKYGVNAWADGWCRANIDWRNYALVVSRYVTPISKIECPAGVRTIVDCDDACYRYPPQRDTVPARMTASALGWVRFRQIRWAVGDYDHAFFCSARDRGLFPARSSSLLPNVVQAPSRPPAAPQGRGGTVLFVGSMWYPPNRHGVEWFLKHCWPALAERCPELALRIVGSAPAADRERWSRAARAGAPGFVEDLGAEYARSLFAIAPVHYGGGTSIKFLEAAAFGRACVVTPHVFEAFGADFRDGESVMVAGSAERMVEACAALFEDAQRRNAMAQRAHEVVTSRYTVPRFKDAVQAAVRRVMAAGAGRS